MKYIITDNKLQKVMRNYIKYSLKHFKRVHDIAIEHLEDNKYIVYIVVLKKDAIELGGGWGHFISNIDTKIKKSINNMFGEIEIIVKEEII